MPDTNPLREKAVKLRALHRPGQPLLLVNVWDCATARILESGGSPAVATTSAGIAFTHGYPDGEKIPRELMLEAVARICRSVSVPVTADVEAGYGASAGEMEATASAVVEAGAVGLNLEDGTGDPSKPLADLTLQLEKIRAVKAASERAGVPLVLNARTDAYLDRIGSEEEMLAETLRRGEAYREAGADCVFVPGVTDAATIGELVRRLACPINILAVAASPPIGDLAKLGVARVSLGSGPMRASVSLLQRLAEEAFTRGTYSMLEGILSHARLNQLVA